MSKKLYSLSMMLFLCVGFTYQGQKPNKVLTNEDIAPNARPVQTARVNNFDNNLVLKEESFDCSVFQRISTIDALLYDGAVLRPDNIGLRVLTNSGTTSQLTDERYLSITVREIVNESNVTKAVGLLKPVLENNPSDYKVLLNDKQIPFKVFKDTLEWENCSGIKGKINFGDKPHVFAVLGTLAPGQKLKIQVSNQGQGKVVAN